MDRNRLIGNNNQLPWHLPADLAHFKKITLNKPILMGRKTYDSIGRPLPGRKNIVLTRTVGLEIEGVVVANSLEAVIGGLAGVDELMVIGGSTVYKMLMPLASRMYLTRIDAEFEGDAWFPEIDKSQWHETDCLYREADETNAYDCHFITLARK